MSELKGGGFVRNSERRQIQSPSGFETEETKGVAYTYQAGGSSEKLQHISEI